MIRLATLFSGIGAIEQALLKTNTIIKTVIKVLKYLFISFEDKTSRRIYTRAMLWYILGEYTNDGFARHHTEAEKGIKKNAPITNIKLTIFL